MNSLDKLPLEIVCPECQGHGKFPDETESSGFLKCLDCNGVGYIPTALGARILALVRHNTRLTVNAELRVAGDAS